MLKTAACIATALVLTTWGTGQARAEGAAPHPPASQLSHADSDFLQQAAQSGHAEIEGSQLALSHGTRPEVKAFAQQIIEEHTKAGEELNALAGSKGVTLSEGPSIAQKVKLKVLAHREGASFDKHYTDSVGLKAHQDAVALFQKASDEARDPDVKAFAVKTLPVLQHHLDLSRDLYATVHVDDARKP